MKIGKVTRKVTKPDVIPVKLPPAKIPAPDIFKPQPVPAKNNDNCMTY